MLIWLRRGLLSVVVLLVAILCAGVTYEQLSRRSVSREYPHVGELVEFDGARSHLNCTGKGSPIVILEAGLSVGGSQDWAGVQPEIAEQTRVCSYDRAGILWSEPRDEPRDANRIAEELHALLAAASEPPPYVMVGHSLGGLLIRVYADRYSEQVAGIVLVDASHPEQFERYPPDVSRAREALESASLPPRFVQQFLAATGAYRLLILPPPQNAITAFLPRTVPSGFSGELAAREAITAQASAATTLGDMPLIVLSAGRTPALPGVSDSALGELAAVHAELQAELAALSSNSQLRTCPDAGHNIQMDDPDAVVAAVSEVVNAVRGPRKLVESRDSAVDSPRAMGDDYDRLSTVNC